MEFHLKSLREAIKFCQTKKSEAEASTTIENKHEALSYTQLERWLQELYAMRGAFDESERAWGKVRNQEWIK